MGTEIERKFLVDSNVWRPAGPGVLIRQGYLSSVKERVVRVRIAGSDAFLTVKGLTDNLITRWEFEYSIPIADATILLDRLCERPLVEKTRHEEKIGAHLWDIDVFHGENEGLILAEVELADPAEPFESPVWIGKEVSDDWRYYNANLASVPFRSWSGRIDGAKA
ncbi:MAG: CYTH domain-containing protein [Beijerinckiaceae bacterium]